MPIDGKCVRCGYKAPLLSFIDAAEYGQFLALYSKMSASVQKQYLKYLSLFQPTSGCKMQHSKVERITSEFLALVAKGYVSEKGKADRACPPHLWGLAMERMQEQSATLRLPMKTHGYLCTIAYTLADDADSKGERKLRTEEANGTTRARRQPEPHAEEMSHEARKYVDKFGEPELPPAIAESLARVKARMQQTTGGDHG